MASRAKKISRALLLHALTAQDSEPAEVMPGLFVGSAGAARNRAGLVRRGRNQSSCIIYC